MRRAWIGDPPRADIDRQLGRYAAYAPPGAAGHWGADELAVSRDSGQVGDQLADARRRAGVDALNLRVHVPGVTARAAREQIERLGYEVLPRLR